MKTLPPFLNGTIDWLYNGAELHPLTEEHVKFITENLDVQGNCKKIFEAY